MLTTGHIAASYLISQSSAKNRQILTSKDVFFIVLCGNIFDFDFFIPPLFGLPGGIHHSLPTHTPFAGIIIFLLLYLLLKNKFTRRVFVLAGIAMLSHLILDDFNYFLGLVGFDHGSVILPQIQWEYPFNFGRKQSLLDAIHYYQQNPISNTEVLNIYLKSKLFTIEIITIIAALFVFLKQQLSSKSKKNT
jgi:hypothetical protein